jgi:lipopolysaccharide export system protein LptA
MRKSEAAKYARWSAALALVCVGLTLGVYLKRGWTRHNERKNAPPAAPVNVERQSSLLTFSKVEQNRKIFTVEASKSIDFKGLNASDLEGVKITIFGKEGNRHDTMETHTCRYSKDSGDVVCSGDVDITLMSEEQWKTSGAALAGTPAAPGTMKVETRGVAFNRASGEAKTDAEVRFSFANGSGQAVGAEYHSEEGTLRLQRNVTLKLDQPIAPNRKNATGVKKEPIELSGTRMDFSRDAGTIYLSGPTEAKTQTERITAAGMLMEVDETFHAKRLTAKSDGKQLRPEFSAAKGVGKQRLAAQEITAMFAPEGWIVRAEAKGQVEGESEQPGETQTVKAQNALMDMVPGRNAPGLLLLKGGVDARTKTRRKGTLGNEPGDLRRLTTEELRLVFSEKSAEKNAGTEKSTGTKLASVDTAGAGRLEWSETGNATARDSQTVLQANQLGMRFDGAGKASRLDAKGDVRTERTAEGAEKQTATAKNGFVELQPQGGWSRIDLSEEVRLNEGTRAAQADHAEFARAEQTVTLTGRAAVRDATSLTTAKKLTLWQSTGEIRGEGGVRSSDLSAHGSAVHLAPAAANVSADQLTGNSKSGRALYTGRARLWQGDSVMEADSIELLKTLRMMNAVGNVRAVFPQAPRNNNSASFSRATPPKQATMWHTQCAKMTYWDQENRARLEQNVVVQAADEKINSNALDLYFMRGNAGKSSGGTQGTEPGGAAGVTGGQQIGRAVATGAVSVQQGGRRATAERGEYTATDGKFVMSGGTPTIFDATEGTTTGRQLTFFLADATIIVDSENGSRTLTKHRVEK